MKDIIVSTKDDFIFKNKLYDEIAIKSIVKKEIDLFIFEENILIKEFENIKKAKDEIEKSIDLINTAFENLYDGLYEEAAMDISSDISVLETLFNQDGLTNSDFKNRK